MTSEKLNKAGSMLTIGAREGVIRNPPEKHALTMLSCSPGLL